MRVTKMRVLVPHQQAPAKVQSEVASARTTLHAHQGNAGREREGEREMATLLLVLLLALPAACAVGATLVAREIRAGGTAAAAGDTGAVPSPTDLSGVACGDRVKAASSMSRSMALGRVGRSPRQDPGSDHTPVIGAFPRCTSSTNGVPGLCSANPPRHRPCIDQTSSTQLLQR